MTQQKEDTVIRTVLEIINAGGIENIGEAISIYINEAMKVISFKCSALAAH